MRRSLVRMAGALVLWAVLPVSGQPGSMHPESEPTLFASDARASASAWFELPDGRLELLGRFEGVVEVRADAGVRIDNWSIDDAMGDSMLVTVLDANPLERRELGDWYGRYEVIVEPLVDGQVTVGPLMLTYLVDPDPEADPTQLQPERVRLMSGSLEIEVASPGGAVPDTPAPAKDPVEADRAFAWRSVLIVGASVGVVGPVAMALVLAARSTMRRRREDAPLECLAELEALERVVRASDGVTARVDGASVAGEAFASVRTMLDRVFQLSTMSRSGPELLRDDRLRSVLSVDGYEHLRALVERGEASRFAGQSLERDRAIELIESAKRIARAVRAQRRGGAQ
ncbi:MAG: hypothetical protein ABL309_06645 [Phycisphaerales bacterium]